MNLSICRWIVGTTLVVVMLAGCSGKRRGPETVRVSGTVYLNDQPLEGAEVKFINMDFVGYGLTGKDGRYELVQGAAIGENVIAIKKVDATRPLDPEGGYDLAQLEYEQEAATGGPGMKQTRKREKTKTADLIPAHFSDPSQSKLTYNVPDGGTTEADLRLTTQ